MSEARKRKAGGSSPLPLPGMRIPPGRIAEMSEALYRQCVLTKGTAKQTSWIPAEFAKEGRILRLKNEAGWDDEWKVTLAGAHLLPGSKLLDHHKLGCFDSLSG